MLVGKVQKQTAVGLYGPTNSIAILFCWNHCHMWYRQVQSPC